MMLLSLLSATGLINISTLLWHLSCLLNHCTAIYGKSICHAVCLVAADVFLVFAFKLSAAEEQRLKLI